MADRGRAKLDALRAQIKLGIDALDRGAAVAIEERDLEGYLASLRKAHR